MDITKLVKELGLPEGSFFVVGSAVLAVHGIREAKDIDVSVTPEVFQHLKNSGWKVEQGVDQEVLRKGPFDIGEVWHGQPTKAWLNKLIYIEGVPFLSLDDLRKWKRDHARPKDLIDVELIDKYLSSEKEP